METIDANLLNEIVRRIVAAAEPEQVILFGSHARGDAHRESDLDLLVVSETSQPRHKRAAPLYGVLSDILTPMDIVVYRPDEILSWSQVPQSFITAIREGSVLYEKHRRPRAGMDQEGGQ